MWVAFDEYIQVFLVWYENSWVLPNWGVKKTGQDILAKIGDHHPVWEKGTSINLDWIL